MIDLEEDGKFTPISIILHGTETFTHATMYGRLDNGHNATLDAFYTAPIKIKDWPAMYKATIVLYSLEEEL